MHLAAILPIGGHLHLGDVHSVYLPWAERAFAGHGVVGVDAPWVYPIGAIVPVLLPMALGAAAYGIGWLLMVTALNAAAVAVLTRRRSRRRWRAAWWWLAFLALLGPIALARLDAVSVALAIVALVWLSRRPRVAVVLLTVATWIKVWPAALIASLLIGMRHRLRTAVIVVLTSAAIVAVPLALGAGGRLLSFVETQDARGLQVESPAATLWLWGASLHDGWSRVVHERLLHTYQVTGPGSQAVATTLTPLLIVAMALVAVLGIRATRRSGAKALPALMFAMVTALLLFDKVLSPQYVTWLAAPLVYGLVMQPRRFRLPALAGLGAALLTQIVYPWGYRLIKGADPAMLAVLGVRNLLILALFALALARLWRAGAAPAELSPDRPPAPRTPRRRHPSARAGSPGPATVTAARRSPALRLPRGTDR